MELSDGVYQIEGVRGANAYVVKTQEGLLVVDTGLPGNADGIVTFVRGLGYAPSDIRTIVITHSDPDHVGSVARLKALTGAKVVIHADDAPTLAGGPSAKNPPGPLAVVFSVLSRFMRVEPISADVVLHDGDSVSGFTVMHTPGHTPGSITLVRDAVVFSGDALLSDSKGDVRLPRKALSANYDQALASADKIRALEYRLLLTGHGKPVFAEEA
ncbi:MAG: MBL fold metallo-hydrolase [Coriobacteriia bacterium]|nr:MBL fold metallo-hydrolase [Coriobacteriia bacterium]